MRTLKQFIEVTGLVRGASCKDVAFWVNRIGIDEFTDDLLGDIIGYYLFDYEEFIFTYENLI